MKKFKLLSFGLLAAVLLSFMPSALAEGMQACLNRQIKNAPDDVSIGEIRSRCSQVVAEAKSEEKESAVSRRIRSERRTRDEPWVITPYRPNYIMPVTYNNKVNRTPFRDLPATSEDLDNVKELEAKFQISLKFPIAYQVFDTPVDVFATFTSQSWWQVYSGDISAPFRETNYEPELVFSFEPDWEIAGFDVNLINFAFNHESNGRSEPLSRSWNRLYASAVLSKDEFALKITPWWRLPEDDEDDDNPNIERYMGYGEILAAYLFKEHVFSAMFRNNLRSDNKTNFELNWSLPIYGKLRLYSQWYYGYGESLLDYNHKVNRVGIGFALNDYLSADDTLFTSPLRERF